MPPVSREGFTVRVWRSGSTAPAGAGFVVGDRHIVTCAHVVNTALDREPRAQDQPGPEVRVQVDFPMLGDADGAPLRNCRVEAWAPPPSSGLSGRDVAGLVLVGEHLPDGAGPARLADQAILRDVAVGVFGRPGDLPGRRAGAWSRQWLRGAVGAGLIQLDAASESAIRAQPGYSGSPAVVTDDAGDAVVGMFVAASRDENARDAYAMPVSQLVAVWPGVLADLTIPRCPYRGLRAFTGDDAEAGLFVGREEEIRQLRHMVDKQTLVVVVGPSGVGKSSLVTAGLIPALEQEEWVTESVRPGGMPLKALAKALLDVERPERALGLSDLAERESQLRSEGLTSLGSQLAMLREKPVFVYVDQLEEVLDPDTCPPDVSAEFLELVLSHRGAGGEGLCLVATLRADFFGRLLDHPDAGIRLQDRVFTLSPMGGEGLERVIEEPATACGVQYERGLVQQIARDASSGGGLPLLEFTLTELWPHQRQRRITFSDYHRFGGVTEALSRYAEQVFTDLAGQFPEERIRHVMLALVRSRGGSAAATRCLVPREDLGADWALAEELAERRLLVLDHDSTGSEDTAELAHEALIRAWPRFASWVDNDADFQHWRTIMEERVKEHDLLSDARVGEAERWLSERPEDIPAGVVRLIEHSRSERHRRVAELKDARNRAQEATARAEEAAKEAEARRLAAAAELALATRGVPLQVPIALAIESLGMESTIEGDIAVRHAIRRTPIQLCRLDHEGPVIAVAFSPDGTKLATGSSDHSARVLHAATGAELCRLDHKGPVNAVAFSPDGTRVATGSSDHSARVLDAATGAELCRLDHESPVIAVAFSPDGTKLATGSSEQTGPPMPQMRRGWAEPRRLGNDDPVSPVAPSPDRTLVATGNPAIYSFPMGGIARVLDAATGAELCRLDHHGPVRAVAFSPDGTEVVTASGQTGSGGSARVLDATTSAELYRLDFDGPVCAVGLSPVGLLVASVTGHEHFIGGDARVFFADSGARLCRLDHGDPVNVLAFSPVGTLVVTGSGESRGHGGSVRVFDAVTSGELCRLDHESPVNAVAFSPDGTRVATASGHSVRVLDVTNEGELCYLDHEGPVNAVAFSLDGTRVATGSSDHSARVLDAATGAELCRLDHEGPVNAVAFSLDGTRVATGSSDHSARVLDAATGAELCRLDHESPVNAVAFSPDGTRVATGSGDHTPSGSLYTSFYSPDELQARRDDTARRGSAWLLDAATGVGLCRLHDGPVNAVAFSPDGTRLATGSGDTGRVGSTRVLDAATGAELCRLDFDGPVNAVAFSPNGSRVASGIGAENYSSGAVGMLDASTGTWLFHPVPFAVPFAHEGPVDAVAFSPDGTGTRLAIACGHSAQVFDAATGATLCRLDHEDSVNAVAFSPDSSWVATVSSDRSAQVFDAATGAELCRLDHHGPVRAVAFSPDGTRVATASSDHRVRVWIVERDQLIRQAADRLKRNLTRQEWRRYFHDEPYRKTRADLPAPDNGWDPDSL